MQEQTTTLYEQIGGKEAVAAAVDVFYDKVIADERIKHHFDDIDMKLQKGKQRAFLTMAFGGPVNYTGQDLRNGHARLKDLNDMHFDAMLEHLEATLRELNVADEHVRKVLEIAESVRTDVLQR